MTVEEVWGRIQLSDATPVAVSGDVWMFALPPGISGDVFTEFWARDDAGNTSYRAAILTIAKGSIKCIRWLRESGCVSMHISRPSAIVSSDRIEAVMGGRSEAVLCTDRPLAVMVPHRCPAMGV